MTSRTNLRCPLCGGGLTARAQALSCRCGMRYPLLEGVPVLVDQTLVETMPQPWPNDVLQELLRALELKDTQKPLLEAIFSKRVRFPTKWMQAEADQFMHRVAPSHPALAAALAVEQPQALLAGPTAPINSNPALKLSCLVAPRSLHPSQQLRFNLRLYNCSCSVLSSSSTQPLNLAYRWHRPGVSPIEGLRTPLLIDLPPGASQSLPVLVQAPETPGHYVLELLPVHETVAWLEDSALRFPVEVQSGCGPNQPDWPETHHQRDYHHDHLEGLRLLQQWCQRHVHRQQPVLVELGGNAHPLIAQLHHPGSQRFCVDIDPYGVAVGHHLIQPRNAGVQFVVADGLQLPFGRRSLDLVALFASFHHFPDPIALLRHLRSLLRPSGLVCLLCEPVGHVERSTLDPTFRHELEKGVNEQSFALWEYAWMAKQAGYRVVEAQVDLGSLKLALQPLPRLQRLALRLRPQPCHPPLS